MQKISQILKKAAAFGTLVAVVLTGLTFVSPAVAQVKDSPDAPFTADNVVVCRVGNGTDPLINTGSAVFLDEYTPAGVLVQSIALPTTASGANKSLLASGTATSEGFLTRSADGRFLVLAGYGATVGGATSLPTTASATVPRVVARIDASGAIDTTTALTDAFDAGTPRSVASSDGSSFYLSGSNGGVRYATLGATTSTVVSSNITNLRGITISGGNLYISNASGTNGRIAQVGTGLPTTTGQTATGLPGIPTTGSPYGFFFADLSTTVAGVDTLYIADDGSAAGGILKFSLVGGSWVANGVAGAGTDAYRGLTGRVNGSTVTLYATRKGGSSATGGGELVSFVDSTGYNTTITATPTLLATAAMNTAFRGVALAPESGTPRRAPVDFNGDGKTDFTVTRNVSNQKTWYIAINGLPEFRGPGWGIDSDLPVPADYDGDGKSDLAVWRSNPTRANFYILRSSNSTVQVEQFGQEGDNPSVVGDYDGDGKADVAVYRPNANNTAANWFYRPSGTPGADFVAVQWGLGFDFPAPGDYDGDGKNDFVVQRDQGGNGVFYIAKSGGGFESAQWGLSTDIIAPGDYDGDGKNDIAVSRSNGNGNLFHYILERDGGVQIFNWGIVNDVRVPGDYNGDGKTDIGVWRSGIFYVRPAGTTAPDISFQWGASTDYPVANFTVQ